MTLTLTTLTLTNTNDTNTLEMKEKECDARVMVFIIGMVGGWSAFLVVVIIFIGVMVRQRFKRINEEKRRRDEIRQGQNDPAYDYMDYGL